MECGGCMEESEIDNGVRVLRDRNSWMHVLQESDFKKAERSTEDLQEFTTKVRKKCESDRNVQFGTGKEQFIRAMDPRSSVVLSDMCRGISAACYKKLVENSS